MPSASSGHHLCKFSSLVDAGRRQIMARRKAGRPLKLQPPDQATSFPGLAEAAAAAAAAVSRLQASATAAGPWVRCPPPSPRGVALTAEVEQHCLCPMHALPRSRPLQASWTPRVRSIVALRIIVAQQEHEPASDAVP